MGFERTAPVVETRLNVAANWKYAYGTYGEGSHFAALHPATIARTAYNDMAVHDRSAYTRGSTSPIAIRMTASARAKRKGCAVPMAGSTCSFQTP